VRCPQHGVDIGFGIALKQAPERVILKFDTPHTGPAAAKVGCAVGSGEPADDEVVDDNAILEPSRVGMWAFADDRPAGL
jgi:hypothetical protein